MKRVCVGIHVHAEPERLKATLDHLQKHTGQAFDLLLLPDGPDSATKAVLDRLRDIPQSGTADALGPPACFNRLASLADADVVVLLESGALVGPNWLDYLLAALDATPLNGLAGPSTNRAWNEQRVYPYAGGTAAEVELTAQQAIQRFGTSVRTLEPLYSLADFCYAVRREVILAIGAADESYGLGPCWEMDYNIRAARAGFQSVWARGAYVYRSPFTARRQREEALRFETSKQRYQDKFCGLRLRGAKTSYEPHCRGEVCEHFAPPDLIQVTLRQVPKTRSSEEPPLLEGTNHDRSAASSLMAPLSGSGSKTLFEQRIEDGDLASVDACTTITTTNESPLVSCIMPTRNRRVFIRQALAYFERQHYPNCELIIVDDGDDQVADLIPSEDPRIRYVSLPGHVSIGAKRNHACQIAHGAIIAHWDDDDWYAPHRLEHQIAPLLSEQADMTGLETSCFFDLTKWEGWTCSPDLHRRLFVGDVHGGTLVYWRQLWENGISYPDTSLAEDALFLQRACRRGARLQKLSHDHSFVYLRHAGNAWRFPLGSYLQPAGWERADPSAFLPAADLSFYAALSPAAPTLKPSAPVSSKNEPLVSCIMPTYNRRAFVGQAIAYFLRQEYVNKELIIVDDGTDTISDLVPVDECIRYIRLREKKSVGAKRNLACEEARGSIIVHWDDDDWHAPHRLNYQIGTLLREGTDVCGTTTLFFCDAEHERAWQYVYPYGQNPWLAGGTLCYTRAFWAGNRFANINVGEDSRFVWSSRPARVTKLADATFYVAMIHQHNVSPKKTNGSYWRPYPVEEIRRLLRADWNYYHPR